MNETTIKTELVKIEKAIAAQEALRGTLSDEQIDASLRPLHEKKAELEAQLPTTQSPPTYQATVIGSGAIAQGTGAKAIGAGGVDVSGGEVHGSIITGNVRTGGSPEPQPDLVPPLQTAPDWLSTKIIQHFDSAELEELCYDLAVDHEQLPGQTKGSKVRALIAHCERSGRVAALMRMCREKRPYVDWTEAS